MRSGTPPWTLPGINVIGDGRGLKHDVIDVAVIGAGISGACMAHALTRDRRRVVVLDRAAPAQGSTMASTALITSELDLPLHRLARSIGTEAAGAAWRHSQSALEALRRLVRAEQIACDWAERSSLYLAGAAYGHRALRAEASMRRALGLRGEFRSPRQLREAYQLERTGAVYSEGMAVADPARLTAGIFRATPGLEVHAPVEVTAAHGTGSQVVLETNRGTLRASTVVFCTGYALLDCLPRAGLSKESTWAVATAPCAPRPPWLDRTIVWEAAEPYLYMRSTAEGRVIVGGLDEPGSERHTDPDLMQRKAVQLARDAVQHLGLEVLAVERGWSGVFGASESGLPVIGPVPGIPGCYVVAGFGGNGITHAMLAAMLISAEIAGSPMPHAALYYPSNTPGEVAQ